MINLKVLAPLLVGALTGIVLVLIGVLAGDDGLKTVGVSVAATALGLGPIGYRAPNRAKRIVRRKREK